MVNIAGPGDTTVVPSGWITDPSVDLDITADPNGSPGIQRIQWRLDGVTTGDVLGTDTTPVTVTGDGIHQLEVRITDDWGRINDWHTHQVKIDTVDPVDNTTVAAGWLPLTYLDVLVRGTDQHSQVQGVEWRLDGGDVLSASSNNHEVRVAGNGTHTLETRIVDNAGRRSIWKVAHGQAGLDAADQHHPDRPRRLAQHALLGRARRLRRRLRRGLGALADRPRERACRRRAWTARATSPAPRSTRDGSHMLHTRIRDAAGNFSTWRDETDPHRPRAPDRRARSIRSAPVGNRHVVTFDPQDDRSGVAGVEWKLDDGTVQTTAHGDDHRRRRAHAVSVRVRDNAGNWSAWADHSITVVLGLDTTAPDRHHRRSRRRGSSSPSRSPSTATDDVDGTGVDYVQWRYGNQPAGQGPNGSEFTISDRRRARDRDARGRQGRQRDPVAPPDAAPGHDPADRDDRDARAAGRTHNTFTLQATDATSGIANLEYKIGNAAPITAANGTTVTLPGDGDYRVSHRALDNAGQSSGWKIDEFTRRHRGARPTRAPPPRPPGRPRRWRWR